MTVYVEDTEADLQWFELWKSTSIEELVLKCSIYGVDVDKWLVNEGRLWRPKYEV